MPRLTAARRIGIMVGAVAYAEDRHGQGVDSVSLTAVAEFLDERVEVVQESLGPLEWVEMEVPGGIVDLVGAIEINGDMLSVEEGWWRRLAVLTPPEAARLYTKAAAAASLDTSDTIHLRTAMAKLRRIVGEMTVIEGDAPENVVRLRSARDDGNQVLVNIEGQDLTVVTTGATFSVVSVFRSGAEWMVTLRSEAGSAGLGLSDGNVMTLPVGRILGVIPTTTAVSYTTESTPTVIDSERAVEVTVEYPRKRDWVLDALAPKDQSNVGDSRRRATVSIWSTGELKTLMLRLGPDATIISPASMQDLQAEATSEILALY